MEFLVELVQMPMPWLAAGLVLVVCACVSVWQSIQFRITYRDFLNLPVVGDPSETDLRSAMEEGTRKYPNLPWILPLQDPTVILPRVIMDEIKSLPESRVSIEASNYRRFFGRYTLMGTRSDEFVATIKQDLNRQVGDLLPEMIEEAKYASASMIGDCTSSNEIPVYRTMLQFIALLSGRAFVGLPLSRHEEWIQSSTNYAVESVAACHELRAYPVRLRRIVALFSRKIHRVKEHQARVREMLHPILSSPPSSGTPEGKEDGEKGRLANWLLHHYNSRSPVPEWVLGKDHLLASFAAIHIATNALTHVLLDLAARPEYIEPLREESVAAFASTSHGKLTMTCLAKMMKMDSFIKESLHMNPPGGIVTLMRETTAPLVVSSGLTIPKGTLIAFANNRFDMSSPQPFDPDEFDGFRYYKLRGTVENEAKYQLITPSPDGLTWGYGSHACPGRLFAATEIKVILLHLITNFDLRLKENESRPANNSHDFQIMPHPDAKIMFTRRK